MVLLAAAVCNKAGKFIISRHFVEMNRSRIEGLLAAFPKLMGTGKQHTFVETESVRYVYQPLEKLYVLLITTKASNILEDLETLRLFARVIPEYCKVMEESEIVDQAFPLIFAFDEIVALGYRENVNLAQIKTFTEMDSHEEKVFQAVRQTQEREARENMKRKTREIQQQKRDAARSGKKAPGGFGGFGGGSSGADVFITDNIPEDKPTPTPSATRPQNRGKAMQLGSKAKDVEQFVDMLKSEGEKVSSTSQSEKPIKSQQPPSSPIHLRLEEKISLSVSRDGGLQNLEVLGMIWLRITDEKFGRVKIGICNNDSKGIQLQTHPNVDKKLFLGESVLALKNPTKPFPMNVDVGVLKWRFQTQDDSFVPLSINCWPNESGQGCDVNIEYELEKPGMELTNATISIPIPPGTGSPVVNECDGEYQFDAKKSALLWTHAVIDDKNKTGSLEFKSNGQPEDFFPVDISFSSPQSYCDIEIAEIRFVEDEAPVKFTQETCFYVEKYEVV